MLNGYLDTVGRPTSDGEGTLPTCRPTIIPKLGVFLFSVLTILHRYFYLS